MAKPATKQNVECILLPEFLNSWEDLGLLDPELDFLQDQLATSAETHDLVPSATHLREFKIECHNHSLRKFEPLSVCYFVGRKELDGAAIIVLVEISTKDLRKELTANYIKRINLLTTEIRRLL